MPSIHRSEGLPGVPCGRPVHVLHLCWPPSRKLTEAKRECNFVRGAHTLTVTWPGRCCFAAGSIGFLAGCATRSWHHLERRSFGGGGGGGGAGAEAAGLRKACFVGLGLTGHPSRTPQKASNLGSNDSHITQPRDADPRSGRGRRSTTSQREADPQGHRQAHHAQNLRNLNHSEPTKANKSLHILPAKGPSSSWRSRPCRGPTSAFEFGPLLKGPAGATRQVLSVFRKSSASFASPSGIFTKRPWFAWWRATVAPSSRD